MSLDSYQLNFVSFAEIVDALKGWIILPVQPCSIVFVSHNNAAHISFGEGEGCGVRCVAPFFFIENAMYIVGVKQRWINRLDEG